MIQQKITWLCRIKQRNSHYKKLDHIEDNQGFSLVELLVALTLFGFLVSGIITFVTAGLEITKKTESQLANQQGKNRQELTLENALVYPITRIDSGISAVATTSGAIIQIDGISMFIGTQSMTGICTSGAKQQYLVTHLANGLTNGETRTVGNYAIADDGLSVYSGSVRIIGNGIRGGNSGLPLETELGGISSITNTGNTLVLADPNNEQLLFWNSSSGTLSAITTRTTGIITPTSVQFFGNSLLIGAKNGLFKMNDSSKTGNTLDTITVNGPPYDIGALGKIRVTFDSISTLTTPNSTPDVVLEKINLGGLVQTLQDSGDSILTTGSGFNYTFSGSSKSLLAGEKFAIGISNIAPFPVTTGQYTADITFFDTIGTLVWTTKIPYFVQGDGSISTLAGNIIEQVSTASQVRKVVNESTFEKGGVIIDDYLNTPGETLVSSLPIQGFSILELSDSLILSFEEYSIYDCREGNHRSQKRTFIFRKKT